MSLISRKFAGRSLWNEFSWAGVLFISYAAFILLFRLLVLTVVTYYLRSTNASFQEISDVYFSNELFTIAGASVLFIVLLRSLYPLTTTRLSELFTPHRFEKRFLPGFLRGSIIAMAVAVAFLAGGYYRYIGFLIQIDEVPMALLAVLLRIIALCVLVYCDEFIFRQKIMTWLRHRMPDVAASIITAAAFCAIKMLQFDLGIMHFISLFLLAMIASHQHKLDEDFVRGAGFISGLLVVFHPLLGLPILGLEFHGVLLLKYEPLDHEVTSKYVQTIRLLTGGNGGPLASLGLQLLLLINLLQTALTALKSLKHKKPLLKATIKRLK